MKKKYLKKRIFAIVLVGVIFLLFSFKSDFFEIAKQIEIYNTLFKELNMYYVDEINPAELTEKAIKNTLNTLDPYTNFYNEQDIEDARIRREGEYGGIGINAYYTQKGIQIKEVYEGFSADKAGLKVGDVIISINNESLRDMEPEQLSMLLKGIPKSQLLVAFNRQGKILKKEIQREKVVINPVPFFEMIDSEMGYIVLTEFNEKASKEVKTAFKELQKKGMKKLVFDLRSNPGGLLMEAVKIVNFFIEKGKVITTTRGKVKKWNAIYKTSNEPLDLQIPIIVLINRHSASASEIVSGALQDYDRAVIFGERSFGKGLVQRYRKLTYGTQLKLTISKYYTPSGRCIQELDYTNRDPKTGIVPKFSDKMVTAFKTEKGRIVYDGGGILPDVILKHSKKSAATEALLKSKAIFNFGVNYFYKNPNIPPIKDYHFTSDDFQTFIKFLATDTTFITKQEKLFQKAFKVNQSNSIKQTYNKIKQQLFVEKIKEITKNKDLVIPVIERQILRNYYFSKGVYQHQLSNDAAILSAIQILQERKYYEELLSVK